MEENKKQEMMNELGLSFSQVTVNVINKLLNRTEHARNIFYRAFGDNRFDGYEWLPSNWVVEERHMNSGRVYKYFYDTEGKYYANKTQILAALEKSANNNVNNR